MHATIHANTAGTSQGTQKQLNQQSAIALAKRFIAEVQAKGLHVRHAILFGSYARNEQTEWSDIDLALSVDEFEGIRFFDNRLIQNIKTKRIYCDIETHTYSIADFEGKDNGFVEQEIKAKGIIIL
ncbi:MAG: nucleotidyltransferase domain-containing protein [Saprospiraceae bacterium]|nr:nucleotidyltransferase domain-containing protein [Saprospiraceae bacterium]